MRETLKELTVHDMRQERRDAGEVESGFCAKDHGKPLMGVECFAQNIVLETSLAAAWVKGVAREKKGLTSGDPTV